MAQIKAEQRGEYVMLGRNRGIISRSFFFNLGLSILLAMLLVEMAYAQGKVIPDDMVSESLEGTTMPMNIYLPPGYEEGAARYPVVYYLHGFHSNQNSTAIRKVVPPAMDSLLEKGEIQEMIIVIPYGGGESWYANSSVGGNYADYITQDLVEFIDSKYHTLAQRESRAIAGVSMGGNGAMCLALKNPDVYSAVVSHSGILSWALHVEALGQQSYLTTVATAFSPNPDSPDKYDWPWDDNGDLIEDVWQRWLEYDAVNLAKTREENVKQLAIYFDHGAVDDAVPVSVSQEFDRVLTEVGIPHVYNEYQGGGHSFSACFHNALPFLSDVLSSEITLIAQEQPTEPEAATSVRAKGKMVTTWARIKNSGTVR
jgi:S-formylglutathione hydrolase FrmB